MGVWIDEGERGEEEGERGRRGREEKRKREEGKKKIRRKKRVFRKKYRTVHLIARFLRPLHAQLNPPRPRDNAQRVGDITGVVGRHGVIQQFRLRRLALVIRGQIDGIGFKSHVSHSNCPADAASMNA